MDESIQRSRQFDGFFGDLRVGVLDIETTGLDRWKNEFILGGLFDVSEGQLHQIFAEHTSEECEALKAFAELLEPFDVVITYNGRKFDMPFLRERAAKHFKVEPKADGQYVFDTLPGGNSALDTLPGDNSAPDTLPGDNSTPDTLSDNPFDTGGITSMPDPYDLDLYRVVRGYSPLKRLLPNLRQKTVEAYMGLWQSRTDEIDGGESVSLYREYERTKAPELEEKILLHNRDDVAQLTRLIKVVDKCDLQMAMYEMGFPVKTGNRLLTVKDIRIGRNGFLIEGTQDRSPASFRCYELEGFDVEALFDSSRDTFSVRMPISWHRGLVVVDIRAAGLDESEFAAFPECGSGFLVIRGERDIRYRECNHLVRAYLKRINEVIDGQGGLRN